MTSPIRLPRLRRADAPVAAVALVAAASTASAGLHPTGVAAVDLFLVLTATAATVAAAATAPWWLVAGAAVIAAALAPGVAWLLLALGGVAVSLFTGATRSARPWLHSTGAATALVVLSRVTVQPFTGFSALVGCSVAVVLLVAGSRRWPAPVRRRSRWVLAGMSAVALAGLGGLALAAWSAGGALRDGDRLARVGLRDLQGGDVAAAARSFDDASHRMDRAADALSAWWAAPARLLPIASQHLRAGRALSAAAADALAGSSDALGRIDPSTIELANGRIDLDALGQLRDPLDRLAESIGGLARTIDDSRSPWLAPPVSRRLDAFADRVASSRPQLEQARSALALAPQLLGAGGERHYLVAFLHPGEARGLGGHMGNFAEVTVADGHISLTRFGRSVDLNRGGPAPGNRVVSGPQEFLRRWGPFGFAQKDGTTDLMPWSNITMPPDLPMVGEVMAELYPQSGGEEIDGVIALLPEALAVLMRATGPVAVPEIGRTVTAQSLVQFIEKDQYAYYDGSVTERVDALEQIAVTTVDRLLRGETDGPTGLISGFRPLIADGRVMAWSAHPDEEALFEQLGMAGRFPALDGRDGIAVTVDNGGANKLDAYLDVSTVYRSRIDPATGAATATATITLTNTVDPTGKPDYAVGNAVGIPRGTNRMMLSAYSAQQGRSISVDGTPVVIDGYHAALPSERTFGWHTSTLWLDVPAGATRVVTIELGAVLDPAAATRDIVVRRQPMALPQRYDVAPG